MKIHYLIIIILALLFSDLLEKTRAHDKKKREIDPAFKERIMNILDSNGEMSLEEKERIFSNIKVAGGKKIPEEKNEKLEKKYINEEL